jgi:hypothetical protein
VDATRGIIMNLPVDFAEVLFALFMGVGAAFYLFFDLFLGTFLRSTL